MDSTPGLTLLISLAILPMVLPTLMAAAKLWPRVSRGQFSVRALLLLLTLAAVGLGIARLDIFWQVKLAILWTLWLCLLGWLGRLRVQRTADEQI
jgi:ABC-type transport system involved in cytochrome c biogenesis permease component